MSDETQLRELIELWRDMSRRDTIPTANQITLAWCADELEAAIDTNHD